ncbi:cytochrome C oxidase subunit I [candidate division WOR-1 bacterium RIFCSPLOWO2_02_FULL_46_20]|uniref:Cytochrome C oxidase subunit I n=1 Tax=candidate division WOR-1 bacterium RIFCSPLOWO2_02_FULL_46_20 TaxID=1802567 RepID=A0A1F4RAM5_UNCSA|nr:MAG: cytochrome C oxidase subunit I [candidate division WOR-1 bacterium RIFCSPLOWO2_02_FULL_46_20]
MISLKELNPLQKVTLRFVVIALLFYGLTVIEGMMMRAVQVNIPLLEAEHFFAVLNAHPIVGIFGYSFMLVMGAFYFLVPTFTKKELYSVFLAELNWLVMAAGTGIVWLSSFIFHYSALYTNYWPLPVIGSTGVSLGLYALGILLIMIGILIFCFNLFATVFHREPGDKPLSTLIISAFGLDGFVNIFNRFRGRPDKVVEPDVPLPIVAIFRGTIDTVLDALVLGSVAIVFLVYAFFKLKGATLPTTWLDPLIYKNLYWWGLDLIADGLVLIYVAGTWYLLAMIITGRQIFMQNFARAALFVELVVSWFVWSHHLLSDQTQPVMMRIFSGEMITAFELVTSGIAVFLTLATLWQARPLKMTMPLKFLLGGIVGFGLGVPAGILQADLGMNRILHNTQWVIGAHAHMQILVGLSCTLFAALYAIFPMVTKREVKSEFLSNVHFWCQMVGGIGMSVAMGFAGLNGMLRRTLYMGDPTYLQEMYFAAFFGTILAIGYLVMMYNLISTIGIPSLISLFIRLPWSKTQSNIAS